MVKDIAIGPDTIGPTHPPYIVAELSGNHCGSLETALKLVTLAKKSGANAIKLQTYTPDTITLNLSSGNFLISDRNSPWYGRTLYDLYKEASLPWEWHGPIFSRCRELNLTAFSTPFDETAVDFLEEFDVPCYKIASLEIVDIPLIKKIASIKKPIILSTGGSTFAEIGEAVEAIRTAGCNDLILLKCTSAYPADPSDANLLTLPLLAKTFATHVGLSDHTLGTVVPIASIALGACFIEKHFTIKRSDGGVDATFSIEPSELESLVNESKIAWKALGRIQDAPLPIEMTTRALRPSLYFIKKASAGEVITADLVRTLRPAGGLPPKEIENILGRELLVDVERGDPISWNQFKQ